jgi:hypothetical protein
MEDTYHSAQQAHRLTSHPSKQSPTVVIVIQSIRKPDQQPCAA